MIIISAAKTMNDKVVEEDVLLSEATNNLVNIIKSRSKEELSSLMKIKNKTLENTYEYYQNFNTPLKAIEKYNGMVFKQIDTKKDTDDLYIVSALYGIINSNDYINSYRLDFLSNNVVGLNLYNYWEKSIEEYIFNKNPNMILNLCSNEYFKALSKKVKESFIIINIKTLKKASSTTLKKVRGEIANLAIEKNIKDYKLLVGESTKMANIIRMDDNDLIIEIKE